MDSETESRLRRLEGLEAIRQLVYRYAALCDDAYNPYGLAELFTEDAYWTASSPDGAVTFGEYHSRDEIRDFFAGVSETLGPMTLHYLMAPSIRLDDDGRSGTGAWYVLVPATMRTDAAPAGEAVLIGSTAAHVYAKVGETWKFARMQTTMHFRSPLARGWVEVPYV